MLIYVVVSRDVFLIIQSSIFLFPSWRIASDKLAEALIKRRDIQHIQFIVSHPPQSVEVSDIDIELLYDDEVYLG